MTGRVAIGVDLGGTNMKAALVREDGRIVRMLKQPSMAQSDLNRFVTNIEQTVDRIRGTIRDGKDELVGLGVGVAGLVSPEQGIVYTSPNIPLLHNTPIVRILEKRVGLPSVLDNDANVVAVGEHWLGAGRGAKNLICITLGTGLGSGIIVNDRIWHGTHGLAGELGHTVLIPEGLPCNCGQWGCVEAYVSATALVRYVHQAVENGVRSSLARYVRRASPPLTAKAIARQAMKGDGLAREAFRQAGRYLGIAITNVLNLIDLERIIIGGGVAAAGDLIVRPARQEVRKRMIGPRRPRLKITSSQLGDRAGPLGAARAAFLKYLSAPGPSGRPGPIKERPGGRR